MRNQTPQRKMDIIDVIPSQCVEGISLKQNARLLTIIGVIGVMHRALKASVNAGMSIDTVYEMFSQMEGSARAYKNEVSRMLDESSKTNTSRPLNPILHTNNQQPFGGTAHEQEGIRIVDGQI